MDAYVLIVLVITLSFGGICYSLGLYTHTLKATVARYRAEPIKNEPLPAVTLGSYIPVNQNAAGNSRDELIGIVDSKTPQRLEWESSNAIEREGKGL